MAKIKLPALFNTEGFNKGILLFDALIWASSFLVIKDVLTSIEVGWMLAIRFIIASALIFIIWNRQIVQTKSFHAIKVGILLGVFGWVAILTQNIGLIYTTPGKNAFLTGTYVVIVPFVAYLWKMGVPKRHNVLGAVLALVGLGFVALDSGLEANIGDALTLFAAVFFALQICETSKSGKDVPIAVITFWEFIVMGFASLVYALLFEQVPQYELWSPSVYASLVFLTCVCSLFALMTTNFAFSRVDPTSGSIIASLEAPIGVALSVAFGFEELTLRLVIGFGLILLGILVSEAGDRIIAKLPI